MATLEQPYLDLLNKIMTEGHDKEDRTGTGTRSLFGAQMRFDLSDGFPILTTKRVSFGLIKSELLWFDIAAMKASADIPKKPSLPKSLKNI